MLNQSHNNGRARDKQLVYTNAKSLGNTTQEPDQLVHVVRPDAAGMQERVEWELWLESRCFRECISQEREQKVMALH